MGGGKSTAVVQMNIAIMLCVLLIMASQGVRGSVTLRNVSSKNVTVSLSDSSTEGSFVLAPGNTVSLPRGAYFFRNIRQVQAELIFDTRRYLIKNSIITPGFLQAFLIPLGLGTIGPVDGTLPITGEF